jgi:O-antigen/teichoic acid export membrane protein
MRQPGGHAQVALFSAAFSVKSMAMFLPLVLNNVGMSILNNQRGLGDQSRFRKVFWTNTGITMGCVLMGALFIAGTGHFLLKSFGHGFTDAYPVLLLLLVSAVIETLAIANYQIIQAQERMWLSLLGVVLPKDIGLVAAAYLLVPSYQAFGLGLAHIVWAAINCLAVLIIAGFIGSKLPEAKSSSATSEPVVPPSLVGVGQSPS